jgi:polypeptide N-acetylgalactosaminyltransferase
MMIYNGENYEMSIKIWLCGGQLLDVPCSHVAHMSKLRTIYRETDYGINYDLRNLKRVAEVWLDDYKQFFYQNQSDRLEMDPGDLTERFKIKERLKCKPFKYFLDEIVPEMLERYPAHPRGDFAKGTIKFKAKSSLCITRREFFNEQLVLTKCNTDEETLIFEQQFTFTWNRFIVTEPWQCIDGGLPNVADCHFQHQEQFWIYNVTTHQLFNPYNDKCISKVKKSLNLTMTGCQENDVKQKFTWEYLNVTALENWENFGAEIPDQYKNIKIPQQE